MPTPLRMVISVFIGLPRGFTRTLTFSLGFRVKLCHCPFGWKFTVDGSGDSDASGSGVRVGVAVVPVWGVFVGVGVAVGVCVGVPVRVGVPVAVGVGVVVGVGVAVAALQTTLSMLEGLNALLGQPIARADW